MDSLLELAAFNEVCFSRKFDGPGFPLSLRTHLSDKTGTAAARDKNALFRDFYYLAC